MQSCPEDGCGGEAESVKGDCKEIKPGDPCYEACEAYKDSLTLCEEA